MAHFQADFSGTGLIEKIKEFETLYGGITNPTINSKTHAFKKTLFDNNNSLNQVDVIQALIIALEIFERFASCISGLDITPHVHIKLPNNDVISERLRVLYQTVVINTFKDILNKHQLKTALVYDLKFHRLPSSNLFAFKEVIAIQKVIQDPMFIHSLSNSPTTIFKFHLERYLQKFYPN